MELGSHQARRIKTRHLQADSEGAISVAAELLRNGQVVAFPTDTVYGIGGAAFDPEAVEGLFLVKGRPLHKGIPVLLADVTDLERVAVRISEEATALIERFWPGPLTLILPKHPDLPSIVSSNDGVAVRIPDSDVARALIRAAGGAVATSSANLSDRTPARSGLEAFSALDGLIAAVLDAGACPHQMASTILDCRGSAPLIVRHGPILPTSISLTTSPQS